MQNKDYLQLRNKSVDKNQKPNKPIKDYDVIVQRAIYRELEGNINVPDDKQRKQLSIYLTKQGFHSLSEVEEKGFIIYYNGLNCELQTIESQPEQNINDYQRMNMTEQEKKKQKFLQYCNDDIRFCQEKKRIEKLNKNKRKYNRKFFEDHHNKEKLTIEYGEDNELASSTYKIKKKNPNKFLELRFNKNRRYPSFDENVDDQDKLRDNQQNEYYLQINENSEIDNNLQNQKQSNKVKQFKNSNNNQKLDQFQKNKVQCYNKQKDNTNQKQSYNPNCTNNNQNNELILSEDSVNNKKKEFNHFLKEKININDDNQKQNDNNSLKTLIQKKNNFQTLQEKNKLQEESEQEEVIARTRNLIEDMGLFSSKKTVLQINKENINEIQDDIFQSYLKLSKQQLQDLIDQKEKLKQIKKCQNEKCKLNIKQNSNKLIEETNNNQLTINNKSINIIQVNENPNNNEKTINSIKNVLSNSNSIIEQDIEQTQCINDIHKNNEENINKSICKNDNLIQFQLNKIENPKKEQSLLNIDLQKQLRLIQLNEELRKNNYQYTPNKKLIIHIDLPRRLKQESLQIFSQLKLEKSY